MNTIDFYVDTACTKNGLSDRQLSMKLGKGPGAVSHWRTKRAWPADNTMVALAELAEMDEIQALIDLNLWRSEGEVRTIYERIASKMKHVAAVFVAAFALALSGQPQVAEAQSFISPERPQVPVSSVYYGK